MKVGYWIGIFIAGFEVTCNLLPAAECFTIPVSVPTGMVIIMALVKIKAIIVKVLLGLKAMGYESFVWRTRRKRDLEPILRVNASDSLHDVQELQQAWMDLQTTVGKIIEFDLDSCLSSVSSGRLVPPESPASQISKESSRRRRRWTSYSAWVSKMIGLSTKDPLACVLLNDALGKASSIAKETDETDVNSRRTVEDSRRQPTPFMPGKFRRHSRLHSGNS